MFSVSYFYRPRRGTLHLPCTKTIQKVYSPGRHIPSTQRPLPLPTPQRSESSFITNYAPLLHLWDFVACYRVNFTFTFTFTFTLRRLVYQHATDEPNIIRCYDSTQYKKTTGMYITSPDRYSHFLSTRLSYKP